MSSLTEKRIREIFFDNKRKPFSSLEIYRFLGFDRHNNFMRSINKPCNYKEISFCDWERRYETVYISRNLFFQLCRKHLDDCSHIKMMYLDCMKKYFDDKMSVFVKRNRKNLLFREPLKTRADLPGEYYTYSLNTMDMACDLNLDAYDLFRFCATKFCPGHIFSRADCTNSYGSAHEKVIPYVCFDSNQHEKRWYFLIFINKVKTDFPLSDIQKEIIGIYYDAVKTMLEKQFHLDVRQGKRKKHDTPAVVEKLSPEQTKQIKKTYRLAAMLCHPDKIPNREAIFKELNDAKMKNNFKKVSGIYERISKKPSFFSN